MLVLQVTHSGLWLGLATAARYTTSVSNESFSRPDRSSYALPKPEFMLGLGLPNRLPSRACLEAPGFT
jgi:hypothetical protein